MDTQALPPQWLVMPGELFVSGGPGRVSTLLGSCVALVVWHPGVRVGGLCHYLLPARARRLGQPRDGQYADEALDMMAEWLARHGVALPSCQAWCFGGAQHLPLNAPGIARLPEGLGFDIGRRNVEAADQLVRQHGLQLLEHDLGGEWPRHVALDLQTGQVSCRVQRGVVGGTHA
jgi:chemotaxis protein CheD